MTSRFILPFADVGTGITPSSGALLYFYESDSVDTAKDTYSDAAGTTPNANPVEANSVGQFPDIFISGSYKVVLTSADGVQFWEADPVTEVTPTFATKTFSTTAAAIADANLLEGDTLIIRDRASATFDVVLSSGVTENGYNIVQCTGVGTLSLALQPVGEVNAQQFGAGLGAGAEADAGALGAALDYAMDNGLPVYVPGGSYNLSTWSSKTIGSPLKIRGESYDSVTFTGTTLIDFLAVDTSFFEMSGICFDTWQYVIEPRASAAATYNIHHNKATNLSQFITFGEAGCNFSLFKLCDNVADTVGTIWCNLDVTGGTLDKAIICNNKLSTIGTTSSTSGIGIRVSSDTSTTASCIIKGNDIKTVRAGSAYAARGIITYNSNKLIISNNTIADIKQDGGAGESTAIYVKAEDGSVTSITGNAITDGGVGTQGAIEVKGGAGDVSITGNTVAFPGNETGSLTGILCSPKARICSIAGNTIRDADVAMTVNCGATISGNTLIDTTGARAIQLFKSDTIPMTVTITGNTIDGVGADEATNSYGICSIENTTGSAQTDLNVTVAGNTLNGVNQSTANKYGVWIRDVDEIGSVTISDNTMLGVDKIAKSQGAATNINSLVIIGNNCPDVTGTGWLAGTVPDNCVVQNNYACEDEPRNATTAEIENISSKFNTINKIEGRELFNTNTNRPVYASGSAAADTWADATGSIAHTPV